MKIAVIGDTHFGVRGDSQVFAAHQRDFFLQTFFPYLEKNEIKNIIHVGDLFDRRKYVNFNTLDNVNASFTSKLIENNIRLDLAVGNHDTYHKNSNEINSPSLIYDSIDYKDIHVYWKEPVELEFDGTKILLCPWICNDNAEDSWKILKNTDAQYVFGHFEIQGFEMYKGAVCEHGDSIDDFSKFDMVASGHFHHKSSYKNITYLGAPYEMTWSDFGSPKGFHTFDTSTGKLEFIENPTTIFRKIRYSDEDLAVEDIQELDISLLTNTYIKVIVNQKNNPYLFDLFIDRLSQSGAADLKVVEDAMNLENIGEEDLVDEAQDTLTILKKYTDSIETKNIDKAKIDACLRELYQEAINL